MTTRGCYDFADHVDAMGSPFAGDPTIGPWRVLAINIILRAARDAKSGNGYAASARKWLLLETKSRDWCEFLLMELGLEPEAVADRVRDLPDLTQPALEL